VASGPRAISDGRNSPGDPSAPASTASSARGRRGTEATTLSGGETSASGLTAPRGEPRLHQQDSRSRDRARTEPHDEAKLTRRLYEEYRDHHHEWVEDASEDLEFYNGQHWTDDQREVLQERGQKAVEIETTYQLVEQAVAMLTANNPSFRATARESSDVSYADLIADLQQWMWKQSDGARKLKAVTRDYYVRGLGYMCAYVDPNMDRGKGEVMLKDLDPFTVLPDPNAKHPLLDDAAHVLVRRVLTAEQIRARWPNAPLQDVQETTNSDIPTFRKRSGSYDAKLYGETHDQLHKKYEVIERYTKVDRPHFRVRNPVTGKEQVFDKQEYRQYQDRPAYLVGTPNGPRPVTGQEEVQALDEIHDQMGAVYHMRRPPQTREGMQQPPQPAPGPAGQDPQGVPGSTRELEPTTAGTLIERGHIESHRFIQERIKVVTTVGATPGRLLAPVQELPVSDYPVVPFPNTHNRNPYPISDVRRVRDLQELINKTNSLILAHAANTTNQKVFFPQGSIQDPGYYEEKWSQAGAQMMPYDPAYGQRGGIEVAAPNQLPAQLYQNQDRFITLMQQTLGIFNLQQGDASNAPDSYQGTLSLDEFGKRRLKSKKDDIEYSLERVGDVATRMAQKLYRPDKVIRLTQPNGETVEQKLGVPGPQQTGQQKLDLERFQEMMSIPYDIMIEGGSTMESNRWAKLQQYMEMYSAGIVDDVAVLKHSDLPDAESILQRKSMYSQMQQNIQALQQTIDNLKSDLQTSKRAEMRAKKEAEMADFTSTLEQMEGNLEQMSQVYQQNLQKEQEKQEALMQERQRQQERQAPSSELTE
jgi:hypothetical protein